MLAGKATLLSRHKVFLCVLPLAFLGAARVDWHLKETDAEGLPNTTFLGDLRQGGVRALVVIICLLVAVG